MRYNFEISNLALEIASQIYFVMCLFEMRKKLINYRIIHSPTHACIFAIPSMPIILFASKFHEEDSLTHTRG